VADVYNELRSFSVEVDVHDPHASSEELMEEYGYGLVDEIKGKCNAVIVAVNHREYLDLDEEYFKSILVPNGIFVDVKGIYRDKIKELTSWSL
jgi:UDP-N-acetyl-D-galactosamine dehydrogenase